MLKQVLLTTSSTAITRLQALGWKPVLIYVNSASRATDCAMVPAVSRLPVTTEAQVRSQVTLFWICGAQSGTGTGVSPVSITPPIIDTGSS